jgi:hypothetical protein
MTTPKTLIPLLALCALVVLLINPVSAQINITPVDIGTTYISWTWNNDLNLTDMYIDGNLMCGYETTAFNYTLSNLNPLEMHTLELFDANTSGTNTTWTLPDTSGAGADDGSTGVVMGVLGGIIGGVIIFAKRDYDKDEERA